MSRRPSNASMAVGRKFSDPRTKRMSLKDNALGIPGYTKLFPLPDIKEGDSFYRTVRMYPSLVDSPEDVFLTIAKMQKENRTGSSAESRRGSMMGRDETSTPTDSPSHQDKER
ncbi:hypothetical protein ACJMK2_027632 [Sinanodonta woodiana]|uniref:Uncharacterized protein n=1 Tax=Sinanodonta woodiana TaxID=1069815 RepID=A0ABD3X614_SINWO